MNDKPNDNAMEQASKLNQKFLQFPSDDNPQQNTGSGKGWHKQPGSIAALLLILAALIILTAWLTGKPTENAAVPTPTAAALNAPQLVLDVEAATPTATAQPTAMPTVEAARTGDYLYHPEGDSIFSIASNSISPPKLSCGQTATNWATTRRFTCPAPRFTSCRWTAFTTFGRPAKA